MSWSELGACVGVTDVDFYPESKAGRTAGLPAKLLCQGCFVRGQCLDWALAHDELGIWGGTSENERKYIKDRYLRPKTAMALARHTGVR